MFLGYPHLSTLLSEKNSTLSISIVKKFKSDELLTNINCSWSKYRAGATRTLRALFLRRCSSSVFATVLFERLTSLRPNWVEALLIPKR